MTMMDSMTDKELDSPNPKIFDEQSRLLRIARGSGQHPIWVKELVGALPPISASHPQAYITQKYLCVNFRGETIFVDVSSYVCMKSNN
jgi:Signal peptide binding domain